MMPFVLVSLVAILAFGLGRRRALGFRDQSEDVRLHSLPTYHGSYAAIRAAAPGLLVAIAWIAIAPGVIDRLALESAPPGIGDSSDVELALLLNDIKNVAGGMISPDAATDFVREAAVEYGEMYSRGLALSNAVGVLVSLIGGVLALRVIRPEFGARSKVESILRASLMLASTFAILSRSAS